MPESKPSSVRIEVSFHAEPGAIERFMERRRFRAMRRLTAIKTLPDGVDEAELIRKQAESS